ncbi:hypothetical protein A2716_02115 [candidate division WWE3 bacterium RIFCSPHIGHO2_01_FULL_40_23]|uniref:Uncharacterized protein n=1 Tax=candidate division WWE3 bacterium RIFCSPLOWO2_01_FULL_41_18 TaxID=1802625 RepID=A0A1F4VGE6_UNCKA|nr:MAG: hypothetical protein A2716_02115 [candidate division WWE3 bacterium RIFCSPHIGHO2_01_FULL_40_23]OGC55783.1 MAG: hypothetical protein A3A78_01965 [candidate division WWE3 bacterium RIFCSPLOWO2_01_FULL_41_18]
MDTNQYIVKHDLKGEDEKIFRRLVVLDLIIRAGSLSLLGCWDMSLRDVTMDQVEKAQAEFNKLIRQAPQKVLDAWKEYLGDELKEPQG